MPVFGEKDIKGREIFPGVTLVQAVEYDRGSQAVTMGKLTLQPGSEIPPHTHPVDDCMIIIQGSGQLYTEDDPVPIEAGCHLWASANSRHGLKNTGSTPLILIYTWPAVNVKRIMVK
ncbi:MAG: cupin domain-containing protein [Deltaproteobacteria bacterium]|nr:cupin domain-containing protein [Deltaproteobacteria bacterium]